MTTESTEPQNESGQSVAAGQGQGHRRRRRRRKSKSSQVGAPQPQQQSTPAVPAASQPVVPVAHHRPSRPQQGAPAQPVVRKRKKFTPKPPAAQPGNQMASSGAPKRVNKSRQKTPREFVGPMDHSYRVANGNVADAPPSTIQLANGGSNGNGNGNGNYYPEVYVPAPPQPVREDAPTRIFCFIDDLFFMAKIQETARKLGVKVKFLKADKEVIAGLIEAPEGERAKLIVIDLNNANAKPMTLIPKLKSKLKKATSVVGFLSHLQGDLKLKALEAGCDTVMPRSAFSQTLPNLLRRYGLEEEEEYIAQPM